MRLGGQNASGASRGAWAWRIWTHSDGVMMILPATFQRLQPTQALSFLRPDCYLLMRFISRPICITACIGQPETPGSQDIVAASVKN